MVATATLDRAGVIAYVGQRAPQYGLDPAAVLAVANHEGLNTSPGATWVLPHESGFNFGPPSWYSGGAGGAIVTQQGQAAPNWAWTPSGIDYWLSSVAQVAQGKTGTAAISAIVTGFERPAAQNISGEIANAQHDYAGFQAQISLPSTIPNVGAGGGVTDVAPPTQVGGTPSTNVAAQAGSLVGALQTMIAGTIGPNLQKIGLKPDLSGLILLLASIFAILIGALIWRGDDVKSAAHDVAGVAMFA